MRIYSWNIPWHCYVFLWDFCHYTVSLHRLFSDIFCWANGRQKESNLWSKVEQLKDQVNVLEQELLLTLTKVESLEAANEVEKKNHLETKCSCDALQVRPLLIEWSHSFQKYFGFSFYQHSYFIAIVSKATLWSVVWGEAIEHWMNLEKRFYISWSLLYLSLLVLVFSLWSRSQRSISVLVVSEWSEGRKCCKGWCTSKSGENSRSVEVSCASFAVVFRPWQSFVWLRIEWKSSRAYFAGNWFGWCCSRWRSNVLCFYTSTDRIKSLWKKKRHHLQNFKRSWLSKSLSNF